MAREQGEAARLEAAVEAVEAVEVTPPQTAETAQLVAAVPEEAVDHSMEEVAVVMVMVMVMVAVAEEAAPASSWT